MTGALVDPRLEAFYASDPSVLDPTAKPVGPTVPAWYDNTVVELAGAILAIHGLIALNMRRRGAPAPDEDAEAVAGQAWEDVAPLWLQMAVPVIKETYGGLLTELTDEELDQLASDYARSLGGYLAETNAEAVTDGYDRALAQGWNERVAWQRVSAAYGLDKPGMRTLMRQIIAQDGDDIVGTAVQTLIDRMAAARAEKIAENEVWNASQSGLALAWLTLQERGDLPATMGREWVTDPNEVPCPICGVMAGIWVPLNAPFTLPDGTQVWAPGAHPNCRCQMELVDTDGGIAKNKDDDPYNRRAKGDSRGGQFARMEYRTRDITPKPTMYAEADLPEVATIAEQLKQVSDPFGVARSDPFGQRTSDAFGTPSTGMFGQSTADAFGVRRASAAEHAVFDAAFDLDHAKKTRVKRKTVVHHIFMPKKNAAAPPQRHERMNSYFLPYWEYMRTMEFDDGYLIEPGDHYNFEEAALNARRQQADYGDFDNEADYENLENDMTAHTVNYGAGADFLERKPTIDQTMEHNDGWRLVAAAGDDPWKEIPDFEDLPYCDIDRDEARSRWADIMSDALPLWHSAIDDPASALGHLSLDDLHEIYNIAGYEWQGGPDADYEAAQRIEVACQQMGLGDDSLAHAFADHVTWNVPGKMGANGRALATKLNDAEAHGAPQMASHPGSPGAQQLFVFENGFHPSTEIRDDHKGNSSAWADLTADYTVHHVVYHSALGDKGSAAKPFVPGIREAYLWPSDSRGNFVHGGPYPEPPDRDG